MINCVIIEDEPLAQLGLIKLIKPFNGLNLLTACDSIDDYLLFKETSREKIDLLFLDIELPRMNGINFLRNHKPEIPVILITAYSHYAVEGYELNVLDYLLKPVSKERFAQCVSKAESYIDFSRSKNVSSHDFIYVRSDKVIEKVLLNEIMIVEAMRNYVIYHCEKRKLTCYTSLKNVEQSLPQNQFIKIQKSFIINRSKVEKIQKGVVTVHNRNIALNRENRSEIIKKLVETEINTGK